MSWHLADESINAATARNMERPAVCSPESQVQWAWSSPPPISGDEGAGGTQELNNCGTTEKQRNGIPVRSFPISKFSFSLAHCSLTALSRVSVTKQNLCPLPRHSMHTAHFPYYPPLCCTVRSMEKLTVSSLIERFKISVVCISICYFGY